MLKVKVAFGEDIRHWHYPTSNRYVELVSFVEKILKLDSSSSSSSSSSSALLKKKEYYFQFEDAEMDRITIGNEQDLLDAFECAQQEKRPSLKIFVIQGSIHDTHEGQTSNSVEGDKEEEEEHVETEVKEECCADSKPERNWCEVALEFVLDEKVNLLFPEVVRRVVSVLREETKNNKQVLLAELVPRVLEEKTFEPIVQHELYQKYLKQILPVLLCQGECFIPILLSLNEAAISLWVADMLKLVTMTLGSEDHGLWNMHMDGWRQQANNEEAVHVGVKCDGCGVTPIRGARYKCAICSDYDLCEKCETSKLHICSHPLVKMSRPMCGRHFGRHYFQGLWEVMGRKGGRGRCQRRQRAEEGEESELPFPYRFGFGRHHGRRPCWMRYACKNDSSTSSPSSVSSPSCKKEWKKECKKDWKEWKKGCKKECKKEKCALKEDKKKCRLQNRKDKLLKKLNYVNSKLSVEEEKKVESSEILNNNNESFEIMCICGAQLVQTIPTQAYHKCKWIICDKCERNCSLNEVIFHCPTEKNPQHPSGYDVCSKCAIAVKEEKEKKEKKEEKPISEVVVEKKPEELSIPFASVVPIPFASAVVPPEVNSGSFAFTDVVDPFAGFLYAAEARSLVDMGFSDTGVIMSLLVSKNGNLEQVVGELLSQ